jgi:phospholipid-translocating ATPase
VEIDLQLLGVTGVEDELQEGIAKCIEDFQEAGIHFWMLTGDKGETAQEIGFSCGLFPRDNFEVCMIKEEYENNELLAHLTKINEIPTTNFGFMVPGSQVPIIFNSTAESVLFLSIVKKAKAVIVFRSSPS